jgi:hypothetical protein
LIITLLVNPEGIAGTAYLKKQQKLKRQAAREAAGGSAPPSPVAAFLGKFRRGRGTTPA